MFCETAQRECLYLDIIEAGRGMSIIGQASENEIQSRYSAQVQNAIDQISDHAPVICDENHCRIIAGLLSKTILNSAHIDTLEKHATGEL